MRPIRKRDLKPRVQRPLRQRDERAVMKITVLIDNNANEGLKAEWGLSLLIEHEGAVYLADTGATDAFAENAAALGIDLSTVDACVLSHAHFDHAGGLRSFFARNRRAPVFVAKATEENCWSATKGELEYIGIEQGLLEQHRDRFVRNEGVTPIGPGAWTLGHSTPGLLGVGEAQKMLVKHGEKLSADDFAHEHSLVLAEGTDIVVVSGCSHAGAAAIIEEARRAFPGKRVKAIVGGLHLYDRSEDEVVAFAHDLDESGIELVLTGHCTGEAVSTLARVLGPRVSVFRSGDVHVI